MIKKISALLLTGVMTVSLVACGGNTSASTSTAASETGAAASEVASSTAAPAGEATGLTEAFAEAPILVTSGGQSADYQMIGTVMGKLGMDYTVINLATSADLGDAKTLIVVVGGSS